MFVSEKMASALVAWCK